MEQKKKHFGRGGNAPRTDNQSGGRISVRPGNFNPPGEQTAQPTQPAAQPAQQGAGGRDNRENRGNRNRRNRDRNRDNRPNGQNGQSGQNPQNNQSGQNAQNNPNGQNGRDRRRDRDRNRRDRGRGRDRDRNRREESAREHQNDAVSATLQRELDEEFSAPAPSAFEPSLASPFAPKKREPEPVEDPDEFAVDIANAPYLVEDIPSGFPVPDGKGVDVVGVRFRHAGRIYFFAPGSLKFAVGDRVIVETARGPELGDIVMPSRRVAEKDVIQPLRPVLRAATPADEAHDAENRAKEAEALKVCEEKIAAHKLEMRLVDAQYTFDNSQLLFYFTSEGRVDFRNLVRDLAGYFHTRIELRQIGIRDESRLIGGLGMCGRPFCCSTFLSDFGQVTVKTAKEQGLSINTSKISGCCGRLMCCLRYEHDAYVEEAKLTPKKDTVVDTPDGRGTVVDSAPLLGTVKVRLDASPEEAPHVYHRDLVTVVGRAKHHAGAGAPAETSAPTPAETEAETLAEDAAGDLPAEE